MLPALATGAAGGGAGFAAGAAAKATEEAVDIAIKVRRQRENVMAVSRLIRSDSKIDRSFRICLAEFRQGPANFVLAPFADKTIPMKPSP